MNPPLFGFADTLLVLILFSLLLLLLVAYQVVKQQGRLLLRLDGIEAWLGIKEPVQPSGLAVGEPFAPFKLPDLDGKEVALQAFLGQKLLLLNWNPQCGYCDLIAPELARLQDDFQKHGVQLVLAAHGDAEAIRKHADQYGLKCPILLQSPSQPLLEFQQLGTPVAYLLDEAGQIAKPLARGAEQVPALAREAIGADPAPKSAKADQTAGVGTELKKLLARIGLQAGPNCPCNARAAVMDRNGCDWCQNNVDTILGWLREEANRRSQPFVEPAARLLVRKAISNARRAQAAAAKPKGPSGKKLIETHVFHRPAAAHGGELSGQTAAQSR